MRVVVGTLTGFIKVISADDGKVILTLPPLGAPGVPIECMCWMPGGADHFVIAATKNKVFVVDVVTSTPPRLVGIYANKAVSLCVHPAKPDHFVVVSETGDVRVFPLTNPANPPKCARHFKIRGPVSRARTAMWPSPLPKPRTPYQNPTTTASDPKGKKTTSPSNAPSSSPSTTPTKKTKMTKSKATPTVESSRPSTSTQIRVKVEDENEGIQTTTSATTPSVKTEPPKTRTLQAVIAAGGNNNNLRVYALDSPKQPLWEALNGLPINHLAPRVWIADLQFARNPMHIAVGTSYKHFRVYNVYRKQRPTVSKIVAENAITIVELHPDGKSAFVGSTIGEMFRVNLRTGLLMGGFKGIAGAVKAIACHPNIEECPFVAAAGLDRYLHVFELGRRQSSLKIYIKHQCSTLLFFSEPPVVAKVKKESADDVWELLDTAIDDLLPDEVREESDRDSEDDDEDGSDEGNGDENEDGSEDHDEDEEDDDEEDDDDEEPEVRPPKKSATASTKAPRPRKPIKPIKKEKT
ncbi:WD repeat domain 74 L-like [Pelomyxa schiedti]|nr:WD repeat domain 74 L-like [Pelomyxa schiedti]